MQKKPRPLTSDFDDAARPAGAAAQNAYVRPQGKARADMDLVIYQTPELAGFEQTAEEAVFILSQSETARRLMQTAIESDYGVVFMNDPDPNLRGYVDNSQRLIFLARTDDPRRLALTLGHELAHVSQKVHSGIEINIIRDHPIDALKTFIAIEADARAYEIKIAIELEFQTAADKDAPRFAGMLDLAAAKTDIAALPALCEKIRPQLPDDIAHDKVMAACFRAFYYDTALRAVYESKVMTRIEQTAETSMPQEKSFQRRIGNDELIRRLDAHDVAYLAKNHPHTDIGDPRLAAVSEYTAARLIDLQELRTKAGFDADDWQAPVYRQAPAPGANKQPSAKKPSGPAQP